jgi:hypothetical protein
MIQRIQSIYLTLTILLSLFFAKGSFLKFVDKSGYVIKVTFSGIIKESDVHGFELAEKLLPLSVVLILIPAVTLITILLFKNRKIQLLLALLVIILIAGLILISAFYSWHIITEYLAEFVPVFKLVIPLLMLLFAILAYIGIRKDDLLVRSYDRLR